MPYRIILSSLVLALVMVFLVPTPVAAQSVAYDAGNNIITVTGGTEAAPATFEDIYLADVAGNWSVVSKQGDAQYEIRARLYIGDGTTTTWFATEREQITFYTTGSGHFMLRTYANAVFRSGVPVSGVIGQGSQGSSFLMVIADSAHTTTYLSFTGGSAYLYQSTFTCLNEGGVAGTQLMYFAGANVVEAYQVQFNGFRQVGGISTGIWQNIVHTGGYFGFSSASFGAGSEYIWSYGNIADVDRPAREDLGQSPFLKADFATVQTFSAIAGAVYHIRDFLGTAPYPVPVWTGSPSSTAIFKWDATVEVTVIEADNTPLENVWVRVYNNADVLQFETLTNAAGYAEGVAWVVRDAWSGSGSGNTRTDYNDFTLRITADGYAVYETEFTIYNPVDYLIVLDGLTYTYDDIMAGQTGIQDWLNENFGGDVMFLILLGGLAAALLLAFVWKRHAFLAYGAAGTWALLGFSAFTISASPNPATITDTYMGLFWVALGFTIVCSLLPTLMRDKPEPDEYPIDALGDDMSSFIQPKKKEAPRRYRS